MTTGYNQDKQKSITEHTTHQTFKKKCASATPITYEQETEAMNRTGSP